MDIDSWDALRVVLAVARGGTLTQAAAELRIDQTTVTRRLLAFQEQLGVALFDRLRGGVVFTLAGEAVVRRAEAVEEQLLLLDREISAGRMDLVGPLRVTLPETFAVAWMRDLTAFARSYPRIELELVISEVLLSLSKHEADVALRAVAASPPEHLVGRKVATLGVAVYVGPALADHPLATLPWVGWSRALASHSIVERWRKRHSPQGRVTFFADSYSVSLEAAIAGAGAVVLPTIFGERHPDMRRVTPIEQKLSVWILTHPELQHTPRVRALMEHLAEMVTRVRDEVSGDKWLLEAPTSME